MHAILLAMALSSSYHGKYPPSSYVGIWDAKLTVDYSSCKERSKGDAIAEQWTVSEEKGKLNVSPVGDKLTKYTGFPDQDGGVDLSFGPEVGIELTGTDSTVTGRKVFGMHHALGATCVIIYNVTATKQK